MAVLVPRTRTIGVRLSEEEYAVLERFCVKSGARSISDLARSAICALLERSDQEDRLVSTVNENVVQLKDLERKLAELAAELAVLKVRGRPHEADCSESSAGNADARR